MPALEHIQALPSILEHRNLSGVEAFPLAGDVAESRAEASGYHGGGEGSVLVDTAAVGVTAPAELMAPALGRDEDPMSLGAPAARGDELDAEQSAPLSVGGSVS